MLSADPLMAVLYKGSDPEALAIQAEAITMLKEVVAEDPRLWCLGDLVEIASRDGVQNMEQDRQFYEGS